MSTKNLYVKGQTEPFPLSRKRIDDFITCQRCFFIQVRLGSGSLRGVPFTLNQTVDALMKKEFDIYRRSGKPHPFIEAQGFDFVPVQHEDIDVWRGSHQSKGIAFIDETNNFRIYGAVDDVWVDGQGSWAVADYKTTSGASPKTEIGDYAYEDGYRRQLDMYSWLFKMNNFPIGSKAYWVYATTSRAADSFDEQLKFEYSLIEHDVDESWIIPTLAEIKTCLEADALPESGENCDMCDYLDRRETASRSLR